MCKFEGDCFKFIFLIIFQSCKKGNFQTINIVIPTLRCELRHTLYKSISTATFETRRSVVDLCTSEYDLQIAVVENSLHPNPAANEESVVRLYDVGRLRAEDIEDVDGEDEDDVDDERDDDDDDDDGDDDAVAINGSEEGEGGNLVSLIARTISVF